MGDWTVESRGAVLDAHTVKNVDGQPHHGVYGSIHANGDTLVLAGEMEVGLTVD